MTNKNIESRIANRTNSVFSALGTIINDFYLEAGIYFVGGFNAALVAWDIYTGLLKNQQPPLYAVSLGIVAFVAVEGLAVYLVGAAAKTNSRLLWVFSALFAAFFTFAHYKEMAVGGVISGYITLAIPFFVVIGYWARTVKNDLEASQAKDEVKAQKHEDERKLLEAEEAKIAEDDRAEQRRIDAEQRDFDREMERQKAECSHALKIAKLASQERDSKVSQSVPQVSQGKTLGTLKSDILAELGQEKPNLTQLSSHLGIGRSTLYRHLGTLAETGEVVKNGNGYELPPTNGHPV